jgi:hypothetical protein
MVARRFFFDRHSEAQKVFFYVHDGSLESLKCTQYQDFDMEEDGTGATPWQGPGRSFSGKTTSIWRRGFVIGDEWRQRKSGDGRQTRQGRQPLSSQRWMLRHLKTRLGGEGFVLTSTEIGQRSTTTPALEPPCSSKTPFSKQFPDQFASIL